ncbi:MAG: hypothetical protein LAT67_10340 [Balneolales bacterium]|nr:hypothetical protein [Balneolales bacterium]
MMNKSSSKANTEKITYLDTPLGIITPQGHQFRTNEAMLAKYAGPLFEIHPVSDLVEKSVSWIESTDGAGIILTLATFLLMPLYVAIPLTITLAFLWHLYTPLMTMPSATGLIRIIKHDLFLFAAAVAPLSWFGMSGLYGHLAAGMILILGFKFGWIRGLFSKLTEARSNDKPGRNDRILNMLIIRFSIREKVSLDNLRKMENDIMAAIQKSKEQRSRLFGKKK